MIKTQKLTPTYYYNESRDFQLFGRIYDIVFNYLKTNIDLIKYGQTYNKLTELLSRTLGFYDDENIEVDKIKKLMTIFTTLIRNKGTYYSVEKLLILILKINNIKLSTAPILHNFDPAYPNNTLIQLHIETPLGSSDFALIERVLDYILPVNCLYEIYNSKTVTINTGSVVTRERIDIDNVGITETSKIANGKNIIVSDPRTIKTGVIDQEGKVMEETTIPDEDSKDKDTNIEYKDQKVGSIYLGRIANKKKE